MFNVVSSGVDRLDIEFNGKLTSDDMRTALDELIEKAKDIENGKMLYQIGDFDLPTLGAIGVELSRFPQLFKLFRKFDKIAIVANQSWIRAVSEVEGALIPGLDIKAFELGNESEAEAWLAS